jgi:hypothetical protein
MPETTPPPDLGALSLAEIATMAAERRLSPVASWNPVHCGNSDMRIAADGTWFHQGSPISRPAMVRLFATVLRREQDGSYVLVTPVEKLDIAVEDLPFVAVELKSEGEGRDRRLAFRLNTDEVVVADAAHPIALRASEDAERPSIRVRDGLDARITRAVYYELVEMALAEAASPPGIWSEGCFFALEAE